MALYTLDQLRGLKEVLTDVHKGWLRARRGICVPKSVKLSLSARLMASRPGAISVGGETLIAFKTLIYTFDIRAQQHRPVSIGQHCFIGGGSVITPGVTIGNQCIVGAGSLVMDDVPDRSIVAGNPARILRRDVDLGPYGVLPVAEENTQRFWTPFS
jgi:maltose O-acetyltransferase